MSLFSEQVPAGLLKRLDARPWFRYGIYRDEVFPVSIWIGSLDAADSDESEITRSIRNLVKPGDPAFVDENEMAELTAFFKGHIETGGTAYLRRYYAAHAAACEHLLKVSEDIRALDSASLDTAGLKRELGRFLKAAQATAPFLWNLIFINEVIASYVQERLRAACLDWDAKGISAFLETISYPEQKLAFQREKKLLLETDLADEGAVGRLYQDFKWLSMGPFSGRPWSLEAYRERIRAMKAEPLLEKNVRDLDAGIAAADEAIASLEDTNLRELVDIVRSLIYLKAHRIDIYALSLANALDLFDEIARRLSLTFEQLLKLAGEEILDALETGAPPHDFDKRETYVYVLEDGTLHRFYGKARAEIEALLYKEDYSSMTELAGRTAYPGVVRGTAKVLMTDLDLHKLEKGDILVANLTNPSFDPAFGIVAGVVTDEGGMLCHSAIMAREFKIPCVIATKLATQVFKDGDLVEVDADKGIVRKIS